MSQLKFKNGKNQLLPTKGKIGNVAAGINGDDVTIVSQTTLLGGSNTLTGINTFNAGNQATSSTTGDIIVAGGIGVTKNINVAAQLVTGKNIVQNHITFTAGTDTTAGWTLANVTTGLIAGAIKTTSAAAVTLILDSVANIVIAFAAQGVTIGAGSILQFIVDNTAGANTVTVQVDGGATIAVATPVLTGGATLILSTANKVGVFQLYLSSSTAAILSRLV